MKNHWETDELTIHFTLQPTELALLGNKSGSTRISFAVLLKFFQHEARFPHNIHEVPWEVVTHVAKQLKLPAKRFLQCDWNGRAIKYHRAQIRKYMGFCEVTLKDSSNLAVWLSKNVLPDNHQIEYIKGEAYKRLRQLKIEPPKPERLNRIIGSSIRLFEKQFFTDTLRKLSPVTLKKMDGLINTISKIDRLDEIEDFDTDQTPSGQSEFQGIKKGSGKTGLESVLSEAAKLQSIHELDLPTGLFQNIAPKVLNLYRQRASVEWSRDLRRHPASVRYTLIAVFCKLRREEITDNLVELLIQIAHRIGSKAEKKITTELLEDIIRVEGKTRVLFSLARAAIANPDGIVREVLYPVVGEKILQNLVKEYQYTGPAYQQRLHKAMRGSYRNHYRRIMPVILNALSFRSNNQAHQPLIRAIELLKHYSSSKIQTYPANEAIPIDDVVRPGSREIVFEIDKNGKKRINRINYEMCVLQTLREKLRCKEIWAVDANRYRNPDEDLPTNFETNRPAYYAALNLPLQAETLINKLKASMTERLDALDQDLPKNPKVKILKKGNGWISLSPLEAQPEPKNLGGLKKEIMKRWHMTSLLDILKEVDLRISFTDQFKTVSSRETLDRKTLQKRLLLDLYALGTNTGIKRISASDHGENYKDLLYVRRKYIHREQIRNAIAQVANAIFRIRSPHLWGVGSKSDDGVARSIRGPGDHDLLARGTQINLYLFPVKNLLVI